MAEPPIVDVRLCQFATSLRVHLLRDSPSGVAAAGQPSNARGHPPRGPWALGAARTLVDFLASLGRR